MRESYWPGRVEIESGNGTLVQADACRGNMTPESFLTASAEIGIGIAGFAGIASVLGYEGRDGWKPQNIVRIQLLLRASFGAVLLSLLPIALASAEMSDESLWGSSSAIYAALAAYALVTGLYGLRGGVTSTEPVEPSYIFFLVGSLFAIITLSVANLMLFQTAWPYLFSLLLTLSIAFIQFVRLLRGLWRNRTEST